MTNFWMVLLLVLVTLFGSALGGYLASKPVQQKALQIGQKIEIMADRLANLKIDVPPVEVPQPKLEVSLSPWSAFWIFVATISGIWLSTLFRKSKIGKSIEKYIVIKERKEQRYGRKKSKHSKHK